MKFFMQETVGKYNMINRGDRIICGLSGGADSVAMLCGLLDLSKYMDFTVCAAHLNHMLRGDESTRDERFVSELCKKLNVELYCEAIDIGALAGETGDSVELAARNARYAFFERAAKACKANKIATAHNADDNLETIIMHLARGSALNGLGGIPPVRGNIIRPLIETTRDDILKRLSMCGQGYVEDSTNTEAIYTRNRIRLNVLPLLREVNPGIASSAVRTAQMLREDEAHLTAQAEDAACRAEEEAGGIVVDIGYLNALPAAVLRRVILILARKAVKFTNYYLEFERICDIINLIHICNPSARLDLPGKLRVSRRYDKLVFSCKKCEAPLGEIRLEPGLDVIFGDYEISCRSACPQASDKTCFQVCLTDAPVTVRPRKSSDTIKLPHRPEKTLKKLFIDEKLPKEERDRTPVLASGDRVLAVYGFGMDERAIPPENKKEIMWVKIRRI